MSKATFYVQFRRDRWYPKTAMAVALTQKKPSQPRRGSGSIVVKLVVEIPEWVFDPLDLVAEIEVPAENTEPLIRLDSVGPVIEPDEAEPVPA